MADNRQVAYALALVSGILSLVLTLAILLVLAGVGAGLAWLMPWGGGAESILLGLFVLVVLGNVVVGAASGVLMLVAAPRLRSPEAQTRRTWALWALVLGIVNVVLSSFVAGALAIAAAVVTYVDLERQAPSGPSP